MLILNYAALSDRGLVRGNNEDSAYAGPHLLALADGMGGHAAGEVASQLMINQLMPLDADPGDNDMLAVLGSVADDANRAIAAAITQSPENDGMGTTLTAIMFNGAQFGLCHVGDSRGYLLREGTLTQITIDDTYVQSLVDKGELSPEDVSTHPRRSLILKAYTGHDVEPTLTLFDARLGDRILLCSDGLSDPVTASTIEKALGEGTPEHAAQRLVELALRSGGPDNVTVVVADVVESDTYPSPLPTTSYVVGALRSDTPEDPRPDTSAGRAAIALSAEPIAAPTASASAKNADYPSYAEPTSIPAPPNPIVSGKKSRRGWLIAIISVLVILALILGGIFWLRKQVNNTYFISTDNDTELVINQGTKEGLLGQAKVYQVACLNETGMLTMIDVDSTNTCHRFTLQDITASARTQVASLPEGTYDEVLQQMQRLAMQLLPLCVVRESSTSDPDDLATPGENCREAH
ncbi:serine/threonine protein phosphatase [Corynebacterium kutscheri]|uniref:Serine/threonine protein phosphatase n=1 Tax=Corynebacterium kutscheri TaxID=35755 RepID=A0A0F6QXY9_9CORY|nr:protein phosphatase 2C domain-containing protein [Corynebacterium kutscheri]AKE40277.1 serine/threonine protein phosphatase [Corynebacterium kutscheri]VEH10669.1 PP2C-family Ser/Thr phosphatase [Corynebacterium kutscheri]